MTKTMTSAVPWVCCGCGAPYPDRVGNCGCSTSLLFQRAVPGGPHERKIHAGYMDEAIKKLGASARRVADQIAEFGKPVDGEALQYLGDALDEFHDAAEELAYVPAA